MINNALKFALGLDDATCDAVSMLLDKLDLTDGIMQHIEQLPSEIQTHIRQADAERRDGVIDDPKDPDNTDFNQYYNKSDTDGWDPSEDKERSDLEQASTPGVADPKDYEMDDNKMEGKQSFLNYINEASPDAVNSEMIDMGDDIRDGIDKPTQNRIKRMQAQGNEQGAERLRKQALRRNRIKQPQRARTPADAMVDAKKRQLVQANKMAEKQREERE